jgi:hypothetical protein
VSCWDYARRYAAEKNTSITNPIAGFLSRLTVPHSIDKAPIVNWLSAILTNDITSQDYKRHLEKRINNVISAT